MKKSIIIIMAILFMTQIVYASSTDPILILNTPVCHEGQTLQNQYFLGSEDGAYTQGACTTTITTTPSAQPNWGIIAILFMVMVYLIKNN